MGEDIESIYAVFHEQAKALFLSLLKDFNAAVEGSGRDRDERLFREQREQYVNSLQRGLKIIAQEITAQHRRVKYQDQLTRNLNHFIADYAHEFVQKVKGL